MTQDSRKETQVEVCSSCRMKVIPMANGMCPSCNKPFEANTEVTKELGQPKLRTLKIVALYFVGLSLSYIVAMFVFLAEPAIESVHRMIDPPKFKRESALESMNQDALNASAEWERTTRFYNEVVLLVLPTLCSLAYFVLWWGWNWNGGKPVISSAFLKYFVPLTVGQGIFWFAVCFFLAGLGRSSH